VTSAALLGRRLEDLRRERERALQRREGSAAGQGSVRTPDRPPDGTPTALARHASELAERLATAVDGEWIRGTAGGYIRVEPPTVELRIGRERLSRLPDGPPQDVPLVCLDTETTGLATGAGTVAFLVGLGTWQGDQFRQVQLLLPDHADEPALLDALAAAIPPDAWLVTYNGRGFDWPLLVTRFRMARRPPPAHAGHVDLLPFVRRVFRHRLTDARLKTVEAELLGLDRGPDVDGGEIPGRYLDFLRGGSPGPLVEVVRHNHEDVRSLARILAHAEARLGDPQDRRSAPVGDLAGLARAYRRVGRSVEALDCLEIALAAPAIARVRGPSWTTMLTTRADAPGPRTADRHEREALLVDRARLLRRLGRHEEALTAWHNLAVGGGPLAGVAWIEVAKVLEHRRRDPVSALDACGAAIRIAERSRLLGRPLARIETDLVRRRRRLVRRVTAAGGRERAGLPGGSRPAWDGAASSERAG
jgi:hypothetical protein